MAWGYRSGDGAVARLNRSDGGTASGTGNGYGGFGDWSATVGSMAATDETRLWENRMFTPSLNAAGLYYDAPSALLVQAGDDTAKLDGTEDLNFAPKVVRYEGMRALPAGERWGWPSTATSIYPKLAFHAPESGYTLCFENRDGVTGLHSHDDGDVKLWNEGRRVTVWLALEGVDVSSLVYPVAGGADFRNLFRLAIEGETCLYRLEEVCDYRPGEPSTKCVFIKHIP
jgi:hypothetical protein